MPKLKKSWFHKRWKQFRQSSLAWGSKQRALLRWSFGTLLRTRSEIFVSWLRNRQCQQYGPKARISELFQRRDIAFHALQSGRLRMKASPPARYYDLLDATAKVGALEVRLGYTFKNRLTCIAALKLFNDGGPLYYDGITHAVDKNNRLALLGDRVLSLVVCQIWFQTEHSNKEHSIMSSDTVSRIALEATGNALGLRKSILVPNVPLGPTQTNFNRDHIAETLEAVLGAIYVDSGYNLQVVSKVLKGLGLHDHRFLKTRDEQVAEDKHYEATHITTRGTTVRDISAKTSSLTRDSNTFPDLGRQHSAKVSSVLNIQVPDPVQKAYSFWTEDAPKDSIVRRQIAKLKKGVSGSEFYKAWMSAEASRLHAAQVATGGHSTPPSILAQPYPDVTGEATTQQARASQKAKANEELKNARRSKAEQKRKNMEVAEMNAAAKQARKKAKDEKDSKAAETALQKAKAEIAPTEAKKLRDELDTSSEDEEAHKKAADEEAQRTANQASGEDERLPTQKVSRKSRKCAKQERKSMQRLIAYNQKKSDDTKAKQIERRVVKRKATLKTTIARTHSGDVAQRKPHHTSSDKEIHNARARASEEKPPQILAPKEANEEAGAKPEGKFMYQRAGWTKTEHAPTEERTRKDSTTTRVAHAAADMWSRKGEMQEERTLGLLIGVTGEPKTIHIAKSKPQKQGRFSAADVGQLEQDIMETQNAAWDSFIADRHSAAEIAEFESSNRSSETAQVAEHDSSVESSEAAPFYHAVSQQANEQRQEDDVTRDHMLAGASPMADEERNSQSANTSEARSLPYTSDIPRWAPSHHAPEDGSPIDVVERRDGTEYTQLACYNEPKSRDSYENEDSPESEGDLMLNTLQQDTMSAAPWLVNDAGEVLGFLTARNELVPLTRFLYLSVEYKKKVAMYVRKLVESGKASAIEPPWLQSRAQHSIDATPEVVLKLSAAGKHNLERYRKRIGRKIRALEWREQNQASAAKAPPTQSTARNSTPAQSTAIPTPASISETIPTPASTSETASEKTTSTTHAAKPVLPESSGENREPSTRATPYGALQDA